MQESELDFKFNKLHNFAERNFHRKFTSSDKNELARAVIFTSYFSKFTELLCTDDDEKYEEYSNKDFYENDLDELGHIKVNLNFKRTFKKEYEQELLDLADKTIEIINATTEFWNLFWQGKHEIDPEKFSFNLEGSLEINYVNLNEMESFTMPFLA